MPPAVPSDVQVDCERQLRQSRIDDQGISTVDHGSYQEAIVQRLIRVEFQLGRPATRR
jgi:hypothetical protein